MPKPSVATWGKKSKLLPKRAALDALNKSPRTINDYAKEVPTNPVDNPHPLLVDLMRVRSQ